MGWDTINRILDNNLGKAAYLKEVASYKLNERKMRWAVYYSLRFLHMSAVYHITDNTRDIWLVLSNLLGAPQSVVHCEYNPTIYGNDRS